MLKYDKMMNSDILTCVGSLVYLEILASCKHLAAVLERAREGLLARVHPNVID